MIGIFIGDRRIGAVMKIMGEPPATRWFAFAPRLTPDQERRQGFPTRKAAIAWLVEIDSKERQG